VKAVEADELLRTTPESLKLSVWSNRWPVEFVSHVLYSPWLPFLVSVLWEASSPSLDTPNRVPPILPHELF